MQKMFDALSHQTRTRKPPKQSNLLLTSFAQIQNTTTEIIFN